MTTMPFRFGGWLAALFTVLGIGQAAALSTQFTYQGRLEQGGTPANGLYDFSFKLFDEPTGVGVVGGPSSAPAVLVTNGIFTVTLDFGGAVFNGADRWLEITVMSNATPATLATLAPRQQLTPSPYAIYAQTSGQAASVNWSSIAGIPSGFADGLDDGTAYLAGNGLSLDISNRFSVVFGGSGATNLVSHSDHHHFGAEWAGDIAEGSGLAVHNAGANGNAVFGSASASGGTGIGVAGRSLSDAGSGVAGFAFGIGTDKNGVYGYASAGGNGVQGSSDSGTGVLGAHTAPTGTNPGVKGQTSSTDTSAVGVLGEVTSTTPGGFSAAVRGINNGNSGSGIGVYGSQAGGGWGVLGTSASGQGVRGEANSGTGVLGYGAVAGVLGSTISPSGVGVYATGSGITGTALAIESGGIRVSGAGMNTATPVFIHRAVADGFLTVIDNPMCNNKPNAMLIVTRRGTANIGALSYTVDNHPVSVWYATDQTGPYQGKWVIANQDSAAMRTGTEFTVLVINP